MKIKLIVLLSALAFECTAHAAQTDSALPAALVVQLDALQAQVTSLRAQVQSVQAQSNGVAAPLAPTRTIRHSACVLTIGRGASRRDGRRRSLC